MSVGTLLGGRYELLASLGHGGFGTVWRAHDRTLGRDVAVKLIVLDNARPGTRAEIAERFEREARAVAALNHPNIVTAHDYGVEGDTAYLVMELISGGSLADELDDREARGLGPLDVDRAVRIGVQIASGLAAAHAAGLIHRDLKPANVMIAGPDDRVKIVDFGIARVADRSRITQTGVYLGTLRYTSPEQMGAGPVDPRSDLYSLGCLLFELMTGRSPYQAETPLQWMAAHQYGTPARLRTYAPFAPAALEALVDQMLAKAPDDRPVSAVEVRSRLEAIGRTVARPAATTVRSTDGEKGPQPELDALSAPDRTPAPDALSAPDVVPPTTPTPSSPVAPSPVTPSPVAAPAPTPASAPSVPAPRPQPAPYGQPGPPYGSPAPSYPPSSYPQRPAATPPGSYPPGGSPQYPPPVYPPGYPPYPPPAYSTPNPGYPGAGGSTPSAATAWPSIYPPATGPTTPPRSLAVAAILLRITAGLSVLVVVLYIAGYHQISTAWQAAFGRITSGSDEPGLGLGLVFAGMVPQVAASLLLAGPIRRGHPVGRVLGWIFIVANLLCCFLLFGATEAFTPQSSDFSTSNQSVLDSAQTQFSHDFPTWLTVMTGVIAGVGLIALIAAGIAMLQTSARAYFRAVAAMRR